MGPVLGGLGIGVVWGWLLVGLAAPSRNRPTVAILALGFASILLATAVYALAGWTALVGLGAATVVGALAGIATRAELARGRDRG
jgi:NhaP-type Na+/H+ or K+/H+ antiporter